MKRLVTLLLAAAMLLGAATAALADSLCPYTGDEVVYEGYAADLGIQEDRNSGAYKAYKELTGNVSINWSTGPWADFDAKTAMFLNTGDLPDIVWLRGSRNVVANYGDMGYFLNFMDYLDYMPNLKAYLAEFGNLEYMKAANGALYCVNDIEPTDYVDESFFFNKTQLDKLGLAVPTTWDEMLAAMRAFKAAVPEGTPFVTYGWGHGYYEYCLGSICNASTRFYYDGSKWTHALLSEDSHYKDLIGMIATMYKEGLIHPEYSTMSDEQAYQIIQDGNWLFTFLYNNTIYNEIFVRQEVPYEYEPMLAPAYKAGDPVYQVITVPYDNLPGWGYFVKADVKNPELMCSLVDTIISKEASQVYNWGVKDVTYKEEDGKLTYLEDYGSNTDRARAFGIGNFMDVRYIQYKMRGSEYAKGSDSSRKAYDLTVGAMAEGKAIGRRALRGTPVVPADKKDAVAAITTPVNTYLDENIMLFVDGTRPMEEWDAFVQETMGIGDLNEVLKIYEESPQIIYSTERKLVTYK